MHQAQAAIAVTVIAEAVTVETGVTAEAATAITTITITTIIMKVPTASITAMDSKIS